MRKSKTLKNNRNYIENDQGLEIFTIPNFLTDDECDYLCKLIKENHSRSEVTGEGNNKAVYDNNRTSSTSNLPASDVVVKQIEDKIYVELNVSLDYSEPIQGQLYQVGQEFKHHNDFFWGDGFNRQMDGIKEHGISRWHRRSFGICKTFDEYNDADSVVVDVDAVAKEAVAIATKKIPSEKTHICDICKKAYVRKGSLVTHMKTHAES